MRALTFFLIASLPAFGAANMQFTAITVNANGQLVGTMSPCVSPLSPSSGVTGITVASNSLAAFVSATASGCVLTINTTAAVGVGTANSPLTADDGTNVAVTLAASSNLTDASGNTVSATGNTSLSPASNSSTWMPVLGTAIAGKIRLDGNPSVNAQGSALHTAQWASANGCARFNANVTGINIFAFNYNNAWVVLQDGAQIGGIANSGGANASTNWSTYAAASGLSGSHLYEICEVRDTPVPVLGAIQLVGGTGYGAQPAAKPWILFFGASEMDPSWFTPGTGTYSAYDTRNHISWLATRPFGYAAQYIGQAGWPVTINTAGSTQYTSNLRDCAKGTALCTNAQYAFGSTPPFTVVFDSGGNDAILSTAIGSGYATAGTFGGDAVALARNLVTRFAPTSGKIIRIDEYCSPGLGSCTAPLTNSYSAYGVTWNGASAYYNSLSPAVTEIDVPSFWWGCTNPSTDFQSGNLHLNPAGNADWANCFLPGLSALVTGSPSYSTSGTPSGQVGTPSSPITVTLAAGATFSTGNGCTSCQTVTLSDGGAGGTFNVVGGASGSSPLTVTPVNGAASFQFTYTAASTAPVTMSFSNGQGAGWVDPPSLSYTPGPHQAATYILIGDARGPSLPGNGAAAETFNDAGMPDSARRASLSAATKSEYFERPEHAPAHSNDHIKTGGTAR